MWTKRIMAAGAGTCAAMLLTAGPAAAQDEFDPSNIPSPETAEGLVQKLTDIKYTDVSCLSQPLSASQTEFTVPAHPGGGSQYTFAQLSVPYVAETPWHEITSVEPGEKLSVLTKRSVPSPVPMSEVLLCSVAEGSGGQGDPFEGIEVGDPETTLAINGRGRLNGFGDTYEPSPEELADVAEDDAYDAAKGDNPVVETDVPADPDTSTGALLALSGGLAGAGAIVIRHRRAASTR